MASSPHFLLFCPACRSDPDPRHYTLPSNSIRPVTHSSASPYSLIHCLHHVSRLTSYAAAPRFGKPNHSVALFRLIANPAPQIIALVLLLVLLVNSVASFHGPVRAKPHLHHTNTTLSLTNSSRSCGYCPPLASFPLQPVSFLYFGFVRLAVQSL